jgi:hypothetical protein
VHVSAGLEFHRGADLRDREARRDWRANLTCRNEAGDLVYGAGGVGAVCGCDPVDLGGDRGDAVVGGAEFSRGLRAADGSQCRPAVGP